MELAWDRGHPKHFLEIMCKNTITHLTSNFRFHNRLVNSPIFADGVLILVSIKYKVSGTCRLWLAHVHSTFWTLNAHYYNSYRATYRIQHNLRMTEFYQQECRLSVFVDITGYIFVWVIEEMISLRYKSGLHREFESEIEMFPVHCSSVQLCPLVYQCTATQCHCGRLTDTLVY